MRPASGKTQGKPEVSPVSIIAWKRSSDDVRLALERVNQAFSRAELLTVSYGLRRVATYHVRSDTAYEDLRYLAELGLSFRALRKVKPVEGFAHRFYSPELGKPYSMYGVVGKNAEDLELFEQATDANDHRTIGELLGYPPCCVAFFLQVWPESTDPVWEAACRALGQISPTLQVTDYYPECVPSLRYFGLRAIPHLPCSLRCEGSREFARKFLEFLPREALELLAMPHAWDAWKGVAIVESPYFVGVANTGFSWERRVVRFSGLGEPGTLGLSSGAAELRVLLEPRATDALADAG